MKTIIVADSYRTQLNNDSTVYMMKELYRLNPDDKCPGDGVKEQSAYEDRPRKQPRDLCLDLQINDDHKNDIVIPTHKSDIKSDYKFKGFKDKVSDEVFRNNDQGRYNQDKSKILLCANKVLWTDKVTQLKSEGYTRKEVLDYIKDIFKKKKVVWDQKRQQKFDKAWSQKPVYNFTIEDIFPEIDLPDNLSKVTDLQKQQVINTFKRLDKTEANRRKKLIDIMLNISQVKHKKQDILNFSVLSDLVYESNLRRKYKDI